MKRIHPYGAVSSALNSSALSRRDFVALMAAAGLGPHAASHASEVLPSAYAPKQLDTSYDFIVCGAGSAGCVAAAKLAENHPAATVLLIEAGGSDRKAAVDDPLWFKNYMNPDSYWLFEGQPAAHLNNRTAPLPMGKIIGGGSSVNALIYARGHTADYDGWAAQLQDPKWSYRSVLEIFKEIESYGGPQSKYRGTRGPLWSEITQNPNDCAVALKAAGPRLGIPAVDDINAETMESDAGIAHTNVITKDGVRHSVARAFLHPALGRKNLTVVSHCEVQRVLIEGDEAQGIEVVYQGQLRRIDARQRIVLSTGALKTPQLLMLSGIGPAATLRQFGIRVVADLPGVGENFHDHPLVGGCVWQSAEPFSPRSNGSQTVYFSNVNSAAGAPDLMPVQLQIPFMSEVHAKRPGLPEGNLWTIAPGLAKPRSRGKVSIRSAKASDHPAVETRFLSDPHDFETLRRGLEQARELGNSPEMRKYAAKEVMPGPLQGQDLREFIKNGVATYYHMSGTAKMGSTRDRMAVVDSNLSVLGVRKLSIADTSVFPDIPRSNTMVPAVVVGYQLAKILSAGVSS